MKTSFSTATIFKWLFITYSSNLESVHNVSQWRHPLVLRQYSSGFSSHTLPPWCNDCVCLSVTRVSHYPSWQHIWSSQFSILLYSSFWRKISCHLESDFPREWWAGELDTSRTENSFGSTSDTQRDFDSHLSSTWFPTSRDSTTPGKLIPQFYIHGWQWHSWYSMMHSGSNW